jgi:hypothetical protein
MITRDLWETMNGVPVFEDTCSAYCADGSPISDMGTLVFRLHKGYTMRVPMTRHTAEQLIRVLTLKVRF